MKIETKPHNERIAEENRERVYRFFQDNPDAFKTDAMRALKMSYVTVCKHVQAINDGWKPGA